jgi:hypothetical protein
MNKACIKLILLTAVAFYASGCSFLLPRSQSITKSRWKSYAEAKAAFDRIVPNETGTNDLAELGFDPKADPNIRVLNYLDIIQRFIPNQAITQDDLDQSVRDFIEAREKSVALEVELNEVRKKRYGNAFLDIFGFKQKTHETGWRFKGLLLLRDGLVVYKLASGEPAVDRDEKTIKPLGPLQQLDVIAVGTAGKVR